MVPLHDGAWWALHTVGMDFSQSDALQPETYNRLLWAGMVGDALGFPDRRDGADLRKNRNEVLRKLNVPLAAE